MIHTMLNKDAEVRQTTVVALRSVAKVGSGFILEVYPDVVRASYSQPICTADGYLPGEVTTVITFPRNGSVVSLIPFEVTFCVPPIPVARKVFAQDQKWFVQVAESFVESLADSVGLGFAQA